MHMSTELVIPRVVAGPRWLVLSVCLSLCGFNLLAQVVDADPEWKEVDVPPPPIISQEQLIPIEMPIFLSLKFGVDPATLTVTKDGVVRYVIVAKSDSGATSAMYEGIRCSTGEFRTYARQNSGGQWSNVRDAQWRPLNDNNTSRHARALAHQGVCEGRSVAATNPAKIIAALRNPQPKSPP